MGGDPSCLTPSADVSLMLWSGLPRVLLDPRTTVLHGIDALLSAELADNENWERLEEMVDSRGLEGLAAQFAQAVETEQGHLDRLRALRRSF